MGAIEDAQLAVFATVLLPSLYILYKHGKRGFLGWLYVHLFCVIRVVGSAMLIYFESKGEINETALIVSSLGLSPLLLSSVGLLHEARLARRHRIRGWFEWFLVINYHAVQAVGIALVASRGASLASIHRTSSDQTILDAGIGLIDACWAFLALATLTSLISHPKEPSGYQLYSNGSKLLYAVFVCTFLILLRIAYATAYYAGRSTDFQTSLAIKVCLSVVPEMVVVLVYLIVGFVTRDMYAVQGRTDSSAMLDAI